MTTHETAIVRRQATFALVTSVNLEELSAMALPYWTSAMKIGGL